MASRLAFTLGVLLLATPAAGRPPASEDPLAPPLVAPDGARRVAPSLASRGSYYRGPEAYRSSTPLALTLVAIGAGVATLWTIDRAHEANLDRVRYVCPATLSESDCRSEKLDREQTRTLWVVGASAAGALTLGFGIGAIDEWIRFARATAEYDQGYGLGPRPPAPRPRLTAWISPVGAGIAGAF